MTAIEQWFSILPTYLQSSGGAFMNPDFKGEPLYQFEVWSGTQASVFTSKAVLKYNWHIINYAYLKCAG